MNTDALNDAATNPVNVLATSLRDTLVIYLSLLEDGANQFAMAEAGKTVRKFGKLLSEASYLDLGEESEEPDDDPDGDEMQRFYEEDEEET